MCINRCLLALVGFMTLIEIGATTPVAAKEEESMVSFAVWSSSGEQEFVTSFLADPGAGANSPRVVSRLRYPLQGTIGELAMEVPLQNNQILTFRYGSSNLRPGQGDDTDWNYADKPDVWYYGTFNTTGTTRYYHLDWRRGNRDHETFIGYRAQHSFLRMQEGHYRIDDYEAVDYDLPGLNSIYDITYQGLWIGGRGRHPISDHLSIEGSIAYSPLMFVQGFGDWNLRDMAFTEEGMGQGADGAIGITYHANSQIDATVGYRYQWLQQRGGQDVTNFAGTPNQYYADWDKAVAIQRGFYGKVNVRF
jgi:hypothetical protein